MSDAPQHRPDDFADPTAQAPHVSAPYPPQPYPGQPYPPQPYPAQHYAGPAYPVWGRPEHPQAQLVLILGIVGIFTGIVSFVAWYIGAQAKQEIEAGAPFLWEGQLKTGYLLGKIFGIISIVMMGLGILAMIAYMVAFAALFASIP